MTAALEVPFYNRELETMSRDQLQALQWQRFKSLAREVFASNAFVQRKWQAAGLRSVEELRTWEDFAALPFTFKREFAEDQAQNPPFGTNLTYPVERYVRVHQTSGTTGLPIRWLDTAESFDWLARCWCYSLRGAGVTAADRALFPFSFSFFIGFWQAFEGAQKVGAMVISAGGLDSLTRLHLIESLQATVLVCTPTYALHLLEVAQERGIDLAKSSVRILLHAGEPGANIPATRRRLEEGWGARCFDHTGMSEVGGFGYECVAQAGPHLIEPEYIVEVVDPATGRPAERGELVLTNLGRTGSPVFRYRTGDLVKLDRRPCACGRTFYRLEGGILGRLDDMIIVRGVNVFPAALEGIVRSFEAASEFQIVVYKRGEMDEICLRLEVDERIAPAEQTLRAIADRVRMEVGIRVDVEAAPLGSLPRSESKSRRLVRRQG